MKHLLIIITTALIICSASAQQMGGDIDEITVESFFFKQKITSSTSPVGMVTAKQIENIPLQGIGDALKIEPGISIKSDGTWSTAPTIRGLSGQRIIVAVDGNRIETATDIAGGMNMINMNDIQKIEIIKSGASSIYGSGAIGGVINFITHPIVYSTTPTVDGSLISSYQSVNNLFDEYVNLYASMKKLYFSMSGSYRTAGNTQTPLGELDNSQFKDYSVNGKLGYRINKQHEIRVQHQNFQARDVGVPGGESFSDPFTVTFPEHSRLMTDVQYLFTDASDNIDLIKVKLYQQYIYRDVYVNTNLPLYQSKAIAIDPTGTHQLFGGLAQTDLTFGPQLITAGIDIWQRQLESTRDKYVSLPDSGIMIRSELPLPKSSYMSNGVFARTQRNFLDNKLKTTLGLRFDYIIINNDEVYDPVAVKKNGTPINVPQRLTIEAGTETKQSWSANIGANYELIQGLNVALSGGYSFRAPSLEEMYKYLNLGSSVKIGSPDLLPEESKFVNLGVHFQNKTFSASINTFVNSMNNMIAEEISETYYDNYDSNGIVTTTDTLPAFILNNIDKALLTGVDASITWQPIKEIIASANMAYTVGHNTTTNGYLPQIAPINGMVSLRYNGQQYIQAELGVEWAGDQDKIAEGETSTSGYTLLNFKVNTPKITIENADIQAFAGVHNILDKSYTNHLSTNRGSITIEPGRNFYVKLILSHSGKKTSNSRRGWGRGSRSGSGRWR